MLVNNYPIRHWLRRLRPALWAGSMAGKICLVIPQILGDKRD